MAPLEEIEQFANVPIEAEVELDRKVMTIAEILAIEPGSVMRLTRSAGENIRLLAGGHLIGFGEIVIIEDAVGVRVTDFNQEE